MRKFLSPFRIIVGTIFIISGLIKANDPMGFSYKMEEYFTVFKSMDSVKETHTEIRDMTQEEIDAVFAGMSSMQPVDYSGSPVDLTAEGARDEFMYVKEEITTYRAVEAESLWNSFCDYMYRNALALSIIVCVLEIFLGLCVLAGVFTGPAAILLLGMIIFFSALTFYSAYFDKVTDCGCFGDALKLTPWQSFTKDMVLLVLILPLVLFYKRWKGNDFDLTEKIVSGGSIVLGILLSLLVFDWQLPAIFIIVAMLLRTAVGLFGKKAVMLSILAVYVPTALSLAFSLHCYNHMPVKDYRPWAVGNSVPAKMVGTPEYADVYMIYKDKQTGEESEHLAIKTDDKGNISNSWDWMDSTFLATHDFVDQRKVIVKKGEIAPIHDFTLNDPETGEEYAETFIFKPGYKFMVVAYDLDKTNLAVQPRLNELALAIQKDGMEIIGATASGDKVPAFVQANHTPFPYYTNDATSLKTIIRSNPGLVLLKDTIVAGQWHYNDLPDYQELKEDVLK